jgi:peptidoglycan/xylan/chitin deacetylase (PgdA/CDA1 family)
MTQVGPVPRKVRARRSLARVVDALGVRPHPTGVRCLSYHSIVQTDQRDSSQMTTPVSLFREQLERLAVRGYRVEQASTVVQQLQRGVAVDAKTIVLTFDDGFANNYRVAFPLLREYGVPATFFVITAALNGEPGKLRNTWPEDYMDWDEAREMQASGLVDFGCHTATHWNLRGLPDATLRDETEGAKRELEKGLGRAVTLFAYPFGSYGAWDSLAVGAIQRAGFLGAFTTVFGVNTPSTDRFLLKRTRVSWTDDIPEFDRLLQGAYDWYALVQRLQRLRAT